MSREQMLEDKILIDVSHLAKQICFDYPVAISGRLFLHIDHNFGLVWELLNLMYFKIKQKRIDGKNSYEIRLGKYTALCDLDDEGKLALTIMMSNEVEYIQSQR
jgi:hypothetical protein